MNKTLQYKQKELVYIQEIAFERTTKTLKYFPAGAERHVLRREEDNSWRE